jgi:hypothetical protein
MSENEWQPVRLKPLNGRHTKAGALTITRKPQFARGGVIVRVRRAEDRSERYTCGAKEFFEVHPEDGLKYWNDCGQTRNFICEHRIDAD